MTTTTYPMARISEALDLLQEHGVISDNLAEHELGCWLQERGLTCADLNAETPRATDAQQNELYRLVSASFESDPGDAYIMLASQFSHGFEADATQDLIADYKETMDLD